MEEISKDPEITIFHDFLSDEDMKFLKYTIMSEMKVTYIDEVFQFHIFLFSNFHYFGIDSPLYKPLLSIVLNIILTYVGKGS